MQCKFGADVTLECVVIPVHQRRFNEYDLMVIYVSRHAWSCFLRKEAFHLCVEMRRFHWLKECMCLSFSAIFFCIHRRGCKASQYYPVLKDCLEINFETGCKDVNMQI